MSYQWYKDGIAITGATMQSYLVTEPGSYTYTADGLPPIGDCAGELCCPVIIEEVSCCMPIKCVPIDLTINLGN